MAIMDVFSGMPPEILREQLRQNEKYLVQLKLDRDCLESDLKLYQFEGYAEFKDVLLEAEKKRIAFLRMDVHSSEVSKHDSLQGQYNQCVILSRVKDQVEQDLAIFKMKIAETQEKISGLTQKMVAKLKKEKK